MDGMGTGDSETVFHSTVAISYDAIRLFAISKLGWIKRHQRKFENQERISPREYKERESHYFQGRRYLLRIKETSGVGFVDLKGKTYVWNYTIYGTSIWCRTFSRMELTSTTLYSTKILQPSTRLG